MLAFVFTLRKGVVFLYRFFASLASRLSSLFFYPVVGVFSVFCFTHYQSIHVQISLSPYSIMFDLIHLLLSLHVHVQSSRSVFLFVFGSRLRHGQAMPSMLIYYATVRHTTLFLTISEHWRSYSAPYTKQYYISIYYPYW